MNTIKHSLERRSFRLICLALIICLGLAMRIGHGQQKQIYHVDEGFSYLVASLGLSEFGKVVTTSAPLQFKGADFLQLYQLRPEDGGKHHLIRALIASDVHPPLYYHALHEVMRWSGGQPNKWQGIGLNLGFYILSATLLYALSRHLLPQRPIAALLAVGLWSLSAGSLQLSLFARMYEIQVFFGLLSIYCWVRLVQSHSQTNTIMISGIGLSVSFWLGYMSHYYTLIFAILLTAGGLILVARNLKKALVLLTSWGLSMGALFLFYPTAWQHLFHSQRGQEIQVLMPKLQQMLGKVPHFLLLDHQLFFYSEVIALIIGLSTWYIWKNKQHGQRWFQNPSAILGGIIITYTLVTSALSPFFAIRYHALSLPIFALGVSIILASVNPKILRYLSTGVIAISFMVHAILYDAHRDVFNPLHNPNLKPTSNTQLLLLLQPRDSYLLWGALSGLKPENNYLLVRQEHLDNWKQNNLSRWFSPDTISQLQKVNSVHPFYILDMSK